MLVSPVQPHRAGVRVRVRLAFYNLSFVATQSLIPSCLNVYCLPVVSIPPSGISPSLPPPPLSPSPTSSQVLFCEKPTGVASFVRQLEPDWHFDSSASVVDQLKVGGELLRG